MLSADQMTPVIVLTSTKGRSIPIKIVCLNWAPMPHFDALGRVLRTFSGTIGISRFGLS